MTTVRFGHQPPSYVQFSAQKDKKSLVTPKFGIGCGGALCAGAAVSCATVVGLPLLLIKAASGGVSGVKDFVKKLFGGAKDRVENLFNKQKTEASEEAPQNA